MNEICKKCDDERTLVNGGYCLVLKHYIEYHQTPPCNKTDKNE